MEMIKVNVDGLSYDAAPEIANFLTKETARADDAETKLVTVNEAQSKLQANHDQISEELKKLKEKNVDEDIQVGVQKRLVLITSATPHLDAETMKKINDMSDKDIKVAVITARFPDVKLDEKDDVYIDARFDGVLEMDPKKGDDNAMATQRQKVNPQSNNDDSDLPDQDKSRKKHVDGLKDAWKTEQKK